MHKKSILVCTDCYHYFRLEGDATFLGYSYPQDQADQILEDIQKGEARIANLPGFTHVSVHNIDDEFSNNTCECCGARVTHCLQIFAYYNAPAVDRADTATTDDPEFRATYDDYLNETHGMVDIAGTSYNTALALFNVDPVAYNEGFCNWLDSLDDDEYPNGGRYQCPICEINHITADEATECCEEDEEC